MAIGTDLVSVLRLKARLTAVPALAERIFTARERELCAGRTESLAARLAAKEAVLKALGSALAAVGDANSSGIHEPDSWRLTDIEVSSAPGAPPLLSLHGPAAHLAAALDVQCWHLSLAHDGGVALAYVVAEG
ncbi:holo-ACP synthase [Actinomyces trachealis]|uniref:holo-ACP synthase n=1 Tax=Actinomyces trachealis TaxID=2763540 RepID=UPI0018C857C8|nr:holo-ACP synthase [Actinomyces trachealis]